MEYIKVENLTFAYSGKEALALDQVNLTIEEGSFTVLCGKSGCGKSTLLRHFKLPLRPYGERQGQVYVGGKAIDSIGLREESQLIGFVQQDPDNQLVTDKVWHELAFGLENLGLPREIIRRRVGEIATYFGIGKWFNKEVAHLSGGQKQLLNLASTMVMNPKVLVLDEPTAQLDPIAAQEFLMTLRQLNKDLGITILLCEHRLEHALGLCHHVVVMDGGKVICHDEPKVIASKLNKWNDGKAHPMYEGMPAVTKIFADTKLCRDSYESIPLDVREARNVAKSLLGLPKCDESKCQREVASGKSGNSLHDQENPWFFSKMRCLSKGNDNKAIVAKHLWFRYTRDGDDILKDFNLEVEKGQLLAILGENGVGKSTSLKCMMSVERPYQGKVILKEGVIPALVPQNPKAMISQITVEDEVIDGLDENLSLEEQSQLLEEILTLMELNHLRTSNPYDISGGEQQRLAIAKVLARKPNLIFLDEPTKGLDPFFKKTLGRIFKNMTAKGISLVMVSHDVEFCAEFADKSALFFDGAIIAQGKGSKFYSGNQFYTTSVNKAMSLWEPDIVTVEEAKRWMEKQGLASRPLQEN